MKVNVMDNAVVELKLHDLATGLDDTFVEDLDKISKKKMDYLEDIYTNDELTVMLMAYCIKKMHKGKKAYLSKFADKLYKKSR